MLSNSCVLAGVQVVCLNGYYDLATPFFGKDIISIPSADIQKALACFL